MIWDEEQSSALANLLKQIPEITEIVDATRMSTLVPAGFRMSGRINAWDEKPADAEEIQIEHTFISQEYSTFYDFRLITGEMLTDADPDSLVLLNESAIKAFGWHDPVGKHFGYNRNTYTVKGVIKNVYNLVPTIPAKPICYVKSSILDKMNIRVNFGTAVLFKYREGMWKQCKEKIELMMEKDFPDLSRSNILNTEEEYNKFLKSEAALIKILSFAAAICILICIFGFVSLVSLTCEERRKSIAIRKINGATVGDILGMFAREYFLLLFIGAAFALPAGYLIMQRWLEHYAIRTNIPAWIYLSIMCILALVIVLCVGWQVYRSSVENPAEVIKSE